MNPNSEDRRYDSVMNYAIKVNFVKRGVEGHTIILYGAHCSCLRPCVLKVGKERAGKETEMRVILTRYGNREGCGTTIIQSS